MSSIKSALLLLLCAGLWSQCLATTCYCPNGGKGESGGDGSGESGGGEYSKPYSYIGCYRDTATRDLPRLGGVGHMSTQRCYHLCKRWGFRYFGLQYRAYCFCGNVYGMYGKVNDRECSMKCDGNPSEYCGAAARSSIYEIHD